MTATHTVKVEDGGPAFPPATTENNTLHLLSAYGGKPTEFQWLNGLWNTPGTGWGTKPSAMAALGWRYVGPASTKASAS